MAQLGGPPGATRERPGNGPAAARLREGLWMAFGLLLSLVWLGLAAMGFLLPPELRLPVGALALAGLAGLLAPYLGLAPTTSKRIGEVGAVSRSLLLTLTTCAPVLFLLWGLSLF